MTFCSAVFDIGTSSIKGALIDKNGKVYTYNRVFFPPGVQAAHWFSAFERIFNRFYSFAAEKSIRICGICISGNGPSLVAVSRSGCEKLFLWNEALPAGLKLEKTAGTRSIFMPRLEAFSLLYPEAFSDADCILSGQEFLAYKLTGKKITVLPEARYTPAYWTAGDLKMLHIEMPPFAGMGENCGLYRGIPVFAGPPDWIAALIGTATIAPGRACDRAGSSEGLNLCIKTVPPEAARKKLRLLPSPIAPYWNLAFIIPDSGLAFNAYLKENGGQFDDIDSFMKEIEKIPHSPDGRYPDDTAGRGRALIEKIAYNIKEGMDLLEAASGFKPVYTVCGGQAKNGTWCKIKAEITGRRLQVLTIADAELLGNAAIIFTSLKEFSGIKEAAEALFLKNTS